MNVFEKSDYFQIHTCCRTRANSRRRTPMTADPLVIFTPSGKRGRFPAGTPVLAAARAARGRPRLGLRRPRHLLEVPGQPRPTAPSPSTASPSPRTRSRPGTPSRSATTGSAASPPAAGSAARRSSCATSSSTCRPRARSTSRSSASAPRRGAIIMDPATRLHYVEVAEPDMHEPSGDLQRLERALAEQWGLADVKGDLRTLQMLQPALRKGDWKVTCAVHRDGPEARILHVWPGFYDGSIYGLAIDVGSTTIAGHLCDLATGEVLASTGLMNPQIRFGEDLMSRVSYAMLNPGGAARDDPRGARRAERRSPPRPPPRPASHRELIFEAVIVGNPVMHHLVLGIDPTELGQAPFALATADALHLWAEEIELRLHPDARIYILPCIAGHVGADAAAVALSEAPEPVRRADARRRRRHQRRDPARQPRPRARLLLADRPGLRGRADLLRPARRPRRHRAGRDRPGDQRAALPRHRLRALVRRPGLPAATPAVTGICGSGIIEAIAEMRLAGLLDASGLIGSAEQTGSDRCVPAGPHPRLPPARRHPRHPGRRPRHPARQVRALRRRAPADGRVRHRHGRPHRARRRLRRAHLAEARDGPRHDPRLRPRPGHLRRQRRRHRRPHRAPERRRPARGRGAGQPHPQGRDRDRAALPGALRRRERHPARDRPLPAPRRRCPGRFNAEGGRRRRGAAEGKWSG